MEATNIKLTGEAVTDDGWRHRCYRFDLIVAGEAMILNAPLRRGMGLNDPPTPDDILESLALDFQSVEGYEDWIDWADDLGLLIDGADAARKARDDFREIKARASLIAEAGEEIPSPRRA